MINKITIYSNNFNNKNCKNFNIINKKKEALNIGRSKGTVAERINFLNQDDNLYHIAIETLTPKEQQQVRLEGLSWFKTLRWRPLTIKDVNGEEITVLVNIQSAIKRLRYTGLSEEAIKKALKEGNLIEIAQEEYLKKTLNGNHILIKSFEKDEKDKIVNFFIKSILSGEMTELEVQQLIQKIHSNHIQELKFENIVKFQDDFLFSRALEKYPAIKDRDDLLKKIKDLKNKFLKSSYEEIIRQFQHKRVEKALKYRKNFDCSLKEGLWIHDFGKFVYSSAEIAYSALSAIKSGKVSEEEVKELFDFHAKGLSEKPIATAEEFNKVIDLYLLEKTIKNNEFLKFFLDEIIELKQKSPSLNNNEIIAQFQEKLEEIISQYSQKFGCGKQEALLIFKYEKTFQYSSEVAYQAVQQLGTRLNLIQIKQIVHLVKEKKEEWQKQADLAKQPIKIRTKDFPGKLPRSIQYNPDGTIYILFNKVQLAKDELIGKGTFKKAKLALDLIHAETVVRVTEEASQLALSELEVASQLSGQEGIAQVYRMTKITFPSFMPGRPAKMAYMLKFYNGGDVEAAIAPDNPSKNKKNYPAPTEKEKFLVAQKLFKGLKWLHEEKEMIHRDIKPANLFLIRDPKTKEIIDCVVADFGFTCTITDVNARRYKAGTPVYLPPESSKAPYPIDANQFPMDNWAAGIILYQLFKKDIPEWTSLPPNPHWFTSLNQPELNTKLSNLNQDWLPIPKDPHSIGHLIRGLLQPDPENRIIAGEALAQIETLMQNKKIA